jgi:tetratricopeptide (TPR) repeat protein
VSRRASSPTRPPPAERPRTRLRLLWIAGLAALAAIVGIALWLRGPNLPRPNLAGADPELVDVIRAAEAGVSRQPRSALAWGELGLVLMAHFYRQEAVVCFQSSARLDPSNWRWPYYQAACEQWYAPDAAIVTLHEAVSRDPAAPAPRLMLVDLLIARGSMNEARSQLEAVLESHPQNARAHLLLARVLLDQGQLDAALVSAGKAADHRSTRKSAAELQAQILLRQGKTAAAQDLLAVARQLPPDLPWPGDPLAEELDSRLVGKQAALQRVAGLQRAGAPDQALAVVQQAEEKHVDLYWLLEGRLRIEHGDPAGGETALRNALAFDPDSIEVLSALAIAQIEQQKWSEAETTLRDLLAREPGYGLAWLDLGRCLSHSDPKQAVAALRTAVQYMPRSAKAHSELSAALAAQGQHEEAERHANLARRLQGEAPAGTGAGK